MTGAEPPVSPTSTPTDRPASPFTGLAPADRRRVLLRFLIRAVASTAALIALYYAVPLKDFHGAVSVVLLIAALLGVAAIVAWQVSAIFRADYPGLQAIQALAIVIPLFLLLFSASYYVMAYQAHDSFSETLTRTEALYFTVTTFSTVGYGDIVPKTDNARIIVMIQMICDLAIIGFGVKVLIGAVETRRRGTSSGGGEP
jgi:Ion channel